MLNATATVTLSDPLTLLRQLGAHMAEHDLPLVLDGERAEAWLPMGRAVFRLRDPGLVLEASAPAQADIEQIIEFMASHVLEFAGDDRPAIRWSGDAPRGALFADFREMEVVAVRDLTPHMRRITLRGADLGRFATAEHLHVRLYLPPEGVHPPHWPRPGADGLPVAIAPDLRPALRRYTIRRIDVAAGEVEIDFVLHADGGPGAGWAARARPGDLCGMAGPGGRNVKPADWVLLAGDETALPAIARILEELPPTAEGLALIEVGSVAEIQPLAAPAGVRVDWLNRQGAEAGTTDLLPAAIRAVTQPEGRSSFLWVGCEYSAFRAIRSDLRSRLRRSKGDHLVVSYWQRGKAEDEAAE